MPDTETQELALVPEAEHAQIEGLKRVDNPWAEFEAKIPSLESSSTALVVTKENYLVMSDAARAIRLKVRGTRIEIEHKREELVKDLNERTKSINTAARTLREKLEGMEEKLLEQEKFAEIEAAKALAAKREARIAEITPFLSAPPMVDLGLVKDDSYAGMLQDAKDAHAARLAREQKEKEEAEATRVAEQKEQQRVKDENARLKKEADERLRADNERKQQEARLKAERETALAPFEINTTGFALGTLSVEDYEALYLREEEAHSNRLKAAREARQREQERLKNEAALSEIQGIQYQSTIAICGRAGVRSGGTIQCIEETLSETEAWKIDDRFGALKEAAQKTKDTATAQIRAMLETARREAKAKEEADRVKKEADATAKKNREALKKAQDELAATKAAEEKEKKRIADEAAAAAKAPDREKLLGFAERVRNLGIPEFATEAADEIGAKLNGNLMKLVTWIEAQAETLK